MSGSEILVVVAAILLLFGAKSIPEFARFFSKGMRELKKATAKFKKELRVTAVFRRNIGY
jgi:sec-independent protein translocase protein TatA